tara:strand:+ start:6862 stop:7428 length:567 start_codon:yes stop_codon:yes gene_type:complete
MVKFNNYLSQHIDVVESLSTISNDINDASDLLSKTLSDGNKIILCGNGGSASDAQHIAAELIGRFKKERKALSAMSLATDTSALTCIGNDYGYDYIFERQLSGLGNHGDTLIAISTSGTSNNVLKAVEFANINKINVITLTGDFPCEMNKLADVSIAVPSKVTARIQECHILIGHYLCEQIEISLNLV